MLSMVADLNEEILPSLPDRDDPPVRMECKSCHRGNARPLLLKQQMRIILDEFGSDSAAAWYRDMRERSASDGTYDWGEWETNVLAERLDRDARPAIAPGKRSPPLNQLMRVSHALNILSVLTGEAAKYLRLRQLLSHPS